MVARIIQERLLRQPILSPSGAFLVQPLDGPHVCLRRLHVREAPVAFGLDRLATAFMNNPG